MVVQYNNKMPGRTVMVLPASCPHSVVVTIGKLQTQNQSPRHSSGLGGGGGGAVVTND